MTTEAEEKARAALKASAAINQGQQALVEESRVMLAALLRDEMRIAVAEGIAAAMTDNAAERFWNTGLNVLQRQAKERAGGFVLSGLTQMAKKAFWIGVLVLVIYSVGGLTLLKAMWAAVNKG